MKEVGVGRTQSSFELIEDGATIRQASYPRSCSRRLRDDAPPAGEPTRPARLPAVPKRLCKVRDDSHPLEEGERLTVRTSERA
jgi:hypothetical protein